MHICLHAYIYIIRVCIHITHTYNLYTHTQKCTNRQPTFAFGHLPLNWEFLKTLFLVLSSLFSTWPTSPL